MALIFLEKPQATLKLKDRSSNKIFSFNGINAELSELTPADAAEQVNKILTVGNQGTIADENATLVIYKGAIEAG